MPDHLFSLEGRTAVVTGGTSGIGRMIATGLADADAQVLVTGRNTERAAQAAAAISSDQCSSAAIGLSQEDAPGRLAEAVRERFAGRLDILVNNAGVEGRAPINAFTPAEWDGVMDVNLRGTFFVTQAMLPALRAAASPEQPARIINIGSIGGLHVAAVENYAYSASKAGVHHLTRVLSRRLAGEQVLVNAIAPGIFETRMLGDMPEDFVARVRDAQPLKRFGGTDDIAGAAVFLASRAGGYVNGVVLPVDGGYLASL